MSKKSKLTFWILSIFVCSMTFSLIDQKNATTVSSDNNKAFKLGKESLKTVQHDNSAKSIAQSVQHINVINNLKKVGAVTADTTQSSVFLISDITTPNNLPEYLYNTPFTTLDINYDTLSKLSAEDTFSIPLVSDESLNLTVDKNSRQQNLSIIKAFIKMGEKTLPASLSYRKGSILGSITTINGEYRISKISGVHVIYKIPDLEGAPDNDAMIVSTQLKK